MGYGLPERPGREDGGTALSLLLYLVNELIDVKKFPPFFNLCISKC